MTLEKSRRRRQHGANHKRRNDWQEETLGEVKNGANGDDQKRDQAKSDEIVASDLPRFGIIVRRPGARDIVGRRTVVG